MFDLNKCRNCTSFETCQIARALETDPERVERELGMHGQACYKAKPDPLINCSNCIRQDYCLWVAIRDETLRIMGCPHTSDASNFIDIKQLLKQSINNQSF